MKKTIKSRSNKAGYVDGFVVMVPKKNVAAYKKMATFGAKIWKKHGALDYKECLVDDIAPGNGEHKILRFADMVKLKPDETIFFSYITYKSRAHRDKVNAKVMKDPAMNPEKYKDEPMPFEMERMAYAGFKTLVDY